MSPAPASNLSANATDGVGRVCLMSRSRGASGAGDNRDNPSLTELPLTVVIGAVWMFLVGAPREIDLGLVTLSGALTLLVAALTLIMLPVSIINSSRDLTRSSATTRPTGSRLPWTLWAFLVIVLGNLVAFSSAGIPDSTYAVQNACVYISFIGSIVFAAGIRSLPIVLRAWEYLRTAATWLAYFMLFLVLSGLSTVTSNRALAIVGLIVLAIVIPGTPQNIWLKFAPFVAITSLALTLSRTATAIAVAMLVFLPLRTERIKAMGGSKRFFLGLFSVIVSAIVAYALVALYAPFRNRFLPRGDKAFQIGDTNISTQGRARLWRLVMGDSSENWLFGKGLGSSSQLIAEFIPGQRHPHNDYLRLFHDFGLVGLTLFVIGYLALIWRAFSRARNSDHPIHWSAFLALIAVGLTAVTDNPFIYPYVMLPLGSLVGLSLALSRFEPRATTERPTPRAKPSRRSPVGQTGSAGARPAPAPR